MNEFKFYRYIKKRRKKLAERLMASVNFYTKEITKAMRIISQNIWFMPI